MMVTELTYDPKCNIAMINQEFSGKNNKNNNIESFTALALLCHRFMCHINCRWRNRQMEKLCSPLRMKWWGIENNDSQVSIIFKSISLKL